jgi:hypothetical protein
MNLLNAVSFFFPPPPAEDFACRERKKGEKKEVNVCATFNTTGTYISLLVSQSPLLTRTWPLFRNLHARLKRGFDVNSTTRCTWCVMRPRLGREQTRQVTRDWFMIRFRKRAHWECLGANLRKMAGAKIVDGEKGAKAHFGSSWRNLY